MRWTVLIAALLVAGCGDQSQYEVERALPKYQGKPANLVFNKWGVPDRIISGQDGTIYQWRRNGAAGECRLEVHTTLDISKGRQADNIMGIRGNGDEAECAAYMRMLNR